MSKKNIILSCLLVVLLVCSCMLMTACAKNYEIKWNIDEQHATVAVEGEKKLPTKAEENSTITFTAEGKGGYQIASVTYKIGGKERSISAKNGKYTVSVTNDLEIIVKTERAIESVSVTTNPTRMTYYTGEELDPDGMVVTVKYKTNETEPVTNYSINYASDEVASFSRGDTGFTVTYKGIVSAPVTFASPVETKVVLDPAGGKISKTALDALKANELLHNVVEDENGVVSFTFADIPTESKIVLPGESAVIFPESEGGYPFYFWSVKSDIPTVVGAKVLSISNNDIVTSTNLVGIYKVTLYTIRHVDLRIDDNTPYLDVEVDFIKDGKAYVYLYEGNANVEVKGDNVEGKKGETKTLSLDLNRLADASSEEFSSFEGKWMDIRVNTDIQGISYSTNVVIDADSDVATVGKMINDNKNTYRFHYWVSDGNCELKVVFRPYKYAYAIDAKDVDGVPSLVIEGKVNTSLADDFSIYANGKVAIEWGNYTLEGTINADGTWKIVKALNDIKMDASVAGLVTFTSADGETVLDAAMLNEGKLDLSGCETAFEYADGIYTGERSYATIKTVGEYKVAIGCDWSEPFLSVVYLPERITYDKIELVAENDKPYAVISGTYGSAYSTVSTPDVDDDLSLPDVFLAMAQQKDGFGIQKLEGDWDNWLYYEHFENGLPRNITFACADGKFTIKIDLSLDPDAADENAAGLLVNYGYYMHLNFVDWIAPEWIKGQSIVVGEIQYTLDAGKPDFDDWAKYLTYIWVKEPVLVDFTATKATLSESEGKVYYNVHGTYSYTCTEAEAKESMLKIKANAQKNPFAAEGNWEGDWEQLDFTAAKLDMKDGQFVLSYDITDVENYIYTGKFNGVDLKPVEEYTNTVTVGGKVYKISVNPNAGDDGNDCWGCPKIEISDAE